MWFGQVSKKASLLGFSLLLSLFGSVWFSSSANAAEITLNATPIQTSSTQVSIDGSSFAYEQTVNQTGWFDKPFVCLRANGLTTSFNTGDLIEFQFLIQTWGDNVAKLNTRLSNYDNVSGFSAISSQVSQFSNSSGQVSVIYRATRDLTLPNNTSFCIRNSDNAGFNLSAFNNVVVTGGKTTHYRLNTDSSSTSQDIENQTQSLIDNENQTRANDESQNQQAGVDAQNSTNLWTNDVLSAFGGLFAGLGSFFTYLTDWMSVDASVGCAFALPFLNETINVDMCNSLPSDIVSVIRNISAFIVFILIILILKSIFEDVFNLLEGSANAG